MKEGQLNFTVTVTYTKGSSSATSDPRNRVLYVVKPPEFDEALRVVHSMSEPGKNRAEDLLDDVRSDHWWASDTNPRYHTLRGIVAAMEAFTNPTVEIRHCMGLDTSCYYIATAGGAMSPKCIDFTTTMRHLPGSIRPFGTIRPMSRPTIGSGESYTLLGWMARTLLSTSKKPLSKPASPLPRPAQSRWD